MIVLISFPNGMIIRAQRVSYNWKENYIECIDWKRACCMCEQQISTECGIHFHKNIFIIYMLSVNVLQFNVPLLIFNTLPGTCCSSYSLVCFYYILSGVEDYFFFYISFSMYLPFSNHRLHMVGIDIVERKINGWLQHCAKHECISLNGETSIFTDEFSLIVWWRFYESVTIQNETNKKMIESYR